jgi:hypothetical protein
LVILRIAWLGWLLSTALIAFDARAHAQANDPAPAATAEASERAHALFASGVDKAKAERWHAAESDFRASHALVPRPSTLYNLALVLYRQRRFQESIELCAAVLDSQDPPADAKHRAHAETLVSRIREQGAAIEVLVTPEHAAWSIDGHVMVGSGPRRQVLLAPGSHVFDFIADGFESRRVELAVGEGDRHTATVELTPVATAAPAPAHSNASPAQIDARPEPPARPPARELSARDRTPQWILLGAGGALLAAAAVTGIAALNADAEFKDGCPDLRDCDADLASVQDRADTLATATDVLLVSGGLAVGGALAWMLLTNDAPKSQHRVAFGASVDGRGLIVRARF